jgi:aspartate 1-decarboxylase
MKVKSFHCKHQQWRTLWNLCQKGARNSGEITLNDDLQQEKSKDDIIIISYATLEFEEAKTFKPWIIFPNENDNSLT